MKNTKTLLLALVCTVLLCGAAPGSIVLYGIENGWGDAAFNRLHLIDHTDASIISSVTITLDGHVVQNSNGLGINPVTGDMYALVRSQVLGGPLGRRLVTLDPLTGVATPVGDLDDNFAGIAFRADGTLIGVTGDGADTPESLFEISTSDASTSFLFSLGNGNDGEAIGIHANGLLYHASGYIYDVGHAEYFESVDLDTQVVTDIGDGSHSFEYDEASALAYSAQLDQMFLAEHFGGDQWLPSLYTIDVVTGATTFVGDFSLGDQDVYIKGLAFVPPPIPEPGTLSLLALAALVCGLRRRR